MCNQLVWTWLEHKRTIGLFENVYIFSSKDQVLLLNDNNFSKDTKTQPKFLSNILIYSGRYEEMGYDSLFSSMSFLQLLLRNE